MMTVYKFQQPVRIEDFKKKEERITITYFQTTTTASNSLVTSRSDIAISYSLAGNMTNGKRPSLLALSIASRQVVAILR